MATPQSSRSMDTKNIWLIFLLFKRQLVASVVFQQQFKNVLVILYIVHLFLHGPLIKMSVDRMEEWRGGVCGFDSKIHDIMTTEEAVCRDWGLGSMLCGEDGYLFI